MTIVRGSGDQPGKSTGQPSAFVLEMFAGAYDGLSLREFPLPSLGSAPNGVREVLCGPWLPEDCGAVLLRWLEAGWVLCSASIGGHRSSGEFVRRRYGGDWVERASVEEYYYILDMQDARRVLGDFATWADGSDQQIQVEVRDEYEMRPIEVWVELLVGMPEELIYA